MNIHDLARHLNVSIGTVSRALNGRTDVSAETRRRVLEAAETLGYSPNQSGRSLRQGATGIIGFMVVTNRERAEKGEAFFMSVFDGLQSHLATRGYDLVVLLSSADQDPNAYLRRVVERRLADAVIISDTQRIDPRVDYLMKRKVPFVTFGRTASSADHAWLDLDFEGVAEQAVDRITAKGHRNIAIATASNEVNYGYVFVDACRAALKKRGIQLREEAIFREPLSEAGGFNAGERLLAMVDRPTAILLVDNKMATGLYHRFQEAGVVPGRDITVIGFDDSPQGEFLTPALTRFRVSLAEIGRKLGEDLISVIEAKAAGRPIAPVQTVWPMELVPGESDGPPPLIRSGRRAPQRLTAR